MYNIITVALAFVVLLDTVVCLLPSSSDSSVSKTFFFTDNPFK